VDGHGRRLTIDVPRAFRRGSSANPRASARCPLDNRSSILAACLALAVALACASHGALAFDLEGHRGARGLAPENTLAAFRRALAIGVTVEGELGSLGSLETMRGDKEDGHGAEGTMTREMLLTDPDQAADFVGATQLDALAIAIGTSHGAYKFSRKPTGDILAIDRIKAIHRRIPNTHLVMHGSSSVPQDLLAEIREFGGDMKETYGVPVEEIQEGIRHGVRKVNIDTDIRLAMTGAIRRYMAENRSKFDPRDYLKPAMAAAKGICKERYEQFGCAGMASRIKPVPLDRIAAKYKAGELRQIVN
jgi:fructose-bisphosphate aldolase class II